MPRRLAPYCIAGLILVCAAGRAWAEDSAVTNRVEVKLIAPQRFNAPKRKQRQPVKPVVVAGTVRVEIGKAPTAQEITDKRYVVEYFLDDAVVHKTQGSIDAGTGKPTFACTIDTTAYQDGKHKLVVNFWDKDGPSAIGVQYVIIKNK